MTAVLTYLIAFVVLISVITIIHESGHFFAARICRVKVLDFSIGMGPSILQKQDKHQTNYNIRILPIGGFVQMLGEGENSAEKDSFQSKPYHQRLFIVLAGPMANFILALVIFFSIYTFVGKDFTPAVINEVQKDSPAMIGGLKQDDIILEIDGNEVQSIMDVSKYITMSSADIIDFKVKRFSDEIILKVKPNTVLGEDNLGNKIQKRMVGIKLGAYNNEVNHVKLGPVKALYHAANEVIYVSTASLKYIGSMIIGKADTSQLGGPIRIAKISGQVAEFGVLAFISMMAYISISLGLVNLFPIPMLDGGHLMFYTFEKILGRPLSQKTQEGFFRIGVFLLLTLMFFTTFNDLKDIGVLK